MSTTSPLIEILDMEHEGDVGVFEKWRAVHPEAQVIDAYAHMLEELCDIRHPQLRGNRPAQEEKRKEFIAAHTRGRAPDACGSWVNFPWSRTVVHFLEKEFHEELRTARNRNLITKEEQKQFRSFPVAVAGLSVGSHAALTIVLQGGGEHMRLADPDVISGSNLNRIRAGFETVGRNKTQAAAQQNLSIKP